MISLVGARACDVVHSCVRGYVLLMKMYAFLPFPPPQMGPIKQTLSEEMSSPATNTPHTGNSSNQLEDVNDENKYVKVNGDMLQYD